MFREKLFHIIVAVYIIVLFFIIGLIINKFSAREHQLVAPVVSFNLNGTKKITTETVVHHIYEWMEMDVKRSRSIIAESIPTLNDGQGSEGLIGEITQTKSWLKRFTNWVLGIDMNKPDSYLSSSIPHLEAYIRTKQVLAQQNNEQIANSTSSSGSRVIKSEKGSIYLNVPLEELINFSYNDSNTNYTNFEDFNNHHKSDTIYPSPEKSKKTPEFLEGQENREIRIPRILIYHTHTTETYIDDTRPQDRLYHVYSPHKGNIVQVGKKLAEKLREKGFYVYHDTTDFVGEVFSNCYINARKALMKIFKEQTFDIVLDLHRNGIDSSTNMRREDYSVNLGGKTAAQLMFLYTEGVLEYSDQKWDPNKEFCDALAAKTNEIYPGLVRDTDSRTGRRYNLDLHPHSLIVEVGFQRNTTEEARYSVELLANVIEKLLIERPVFLLDKR